MLFASSSPINRESVQPLLGGGGYTFCNSIRTTDSGSSGKFHGQQFFSYYIYTIWRRYRHKTKSGTWSSYLKLRRFYCHDLMVKNGNLFRLPCPRSAEFYSWDKTILRHIFIVFLYLADCGRWRGVNYSIFGYVKNQKRQNTICSLPLFSVDTSALSLSCNLSYVYQKLSPKSLLDKLVCTDHTSGGYWRRG